MVKCEKFKCDYCDEEFGSYRELDSHMAGHTVRPIKNSLRIPAADIVLPDGCDPSRYEASQAFVEAVIELRTMYPMAEFDFIPTGYDSDGSLKRILAVAKFRGADELRVNC